MKMEIREFIFPGKRWGSVNLAFLVVTGRPGVSKLKPQGKPQLAYLSDNFQALPSEIPYFNTFFSAL